MTIGNGTMLTALEQFEKVKHLKAAMLKGNTLSGKNKTKMVTIVAQTTGKSLPNDGEIHIRH